MFNYNKVEVQSGITRVDLAEILIEQLPDDHGGRNTWLLSFGKRDEAKSLRRKRGVQYVRETESAETLNF